MRHGENQQVQSKEVSGQEKKRDVLEQMLKEIYSVETVPGDVNIRLKNQLTCRKAVDTGRVSFWWLPATVSTIASLAVGILFCLLYLLINIKGADFWMPNLLQVVSGTWLKLHLTMITVEIVVSWIVTFFGIWKGDLAHSAKLF